MSAFGEWDEPDEEEFPAPAAGDAASARVDDDPSVIEVADRLADAHGSLVVAQAKLAEILEDDAATHVQRVAAQEEVATAQRALDRAAGDLRRTKAAVAFGLEVQAPEGEGGEDPGTYYGSVDEWVRRWLLPTYRRVSRGSQGGLLWRADWWRSAEAVSRLDALWRAWEHLRLDPATGMSVWWRDHADPHMGVLLSPDGPFKGHREAESSVNRAGEQLPYAPPPPGLFPPDVH